MIPEVNDHVLDAVREVRRAIKPKRIKKGRGRPSRRNRARAKKLKEKRDQADRLFRRRHLVVTKNANLTSRDRRTLSELLELSPDLGVLRRFVVDLHALFAVRRSKDQAWKIWRRMRRNQSYLANEHLAKALEVLRKENMVKLLSYLDQPVSIRGKITHEQPRGALQPSASLFGKGSLQMATPTNDCPSHPAAVSKLDETKGNLASKL